MIVKGLIKSINFSDNSCRVRLPVFETAASQGEVVVTAIMSIQPGLYNGYNEGDVVFVDFENNRLNQPVVVGKLYLGSAKETTAKASGSLSVSNLKVSSNATLPIDTKLVLDRTGTTVDVDNGITSYKSITDIIKALYKAESSVTKVSEDQSQVISKIEVTYLSQPVTQEAPTAENPSWQLSTPTAQDEYAIWQKTTCYNYRGQILNTEIICLTSVSYFASYRLRCSTKVHAGTKQTEKLIIEAKVKLGIAEEILDENATLVYKWGEDGEEQSIDSRLELNTDGLEEKNLIISLKHGSSVYDTETIMYSPLNSPILVLTNDSDFLSYKSNGEKQEENAQVTTTAELYLNNSKITPDEVTVAGENPFTYYYKWELVGCTTPDNKTEAYGNSLTILKLDEDCTTATATCTVKYKDTSYTRTFTVAKLFQGTDGISISSQTTYYTLIHNKYPVEDTPIVKPEAENDLEVKKQVGDSLEALPRLDQATTPTEKAEAETFGEWSVTPPAYTEDTTGWKYWTTVKTTFSNGDVEFSTPIMNEDLNSVYTLAQGKTTNYYGADDPKDLGLPIKEGDCWFHSPETFEEIKPQPQYNEPQLYIGHYIKLPDDTYSLVTADNLDYFLETSLVPGTTIAYSRKLTGTSSTLYQWVGNSVTGHWQDVGDELIANKVTVNYVNALDITAKKVTVLNNNNSEPLFVADGSAKDGQGNPAPYVKIAGFDVEANTLTTGDADNGTLIRLNSDSASPYSFSALTVQEYIDFINGYEADWSIKPFQKSDNLWFYDNNTQDELEGKHYLAFSVENSSAIPYQYAITKVTFTKDITAPFKFWIRDTSTQPEDYVIISALGANKVPTKDPRNDEYAIESTKEKGILELVEVTLGRNATPAQPIGAGSYFYIVYRHGSTDSSLECKGQVYLPVDIRLSIGDNFQVLADGSVYANNVFLGGITKENKNTYTTNADPNWAPLEDANLTGTLSAVKIISGGEGKKTSLKDDDLPGVYIGPDGISIGTGFKVEAGGLPQIDEIELTDAQKAELKGSNGRSVISTTKYYKLSASTLYDSGKPSIQEPSDSASLTRNRYWYKSPETFKSGRSYYESVRTIYKDSDNTESFEWSTPVKNSMLTVDFINSLGITAQQITVPANDGSGNLFMADKNSSQIELGGWTIGKDGSGLGFSFDVEPDALSQIENQNEVQVYPPSSTDHFDYVVTSNTLSQTAYITGDTVELTGVIDSRLTPAIKYKITAYRYSSYWSISAVTLQNNNKEYYEITSNGDSYDSDYSGRYVEIEVTNTGENFYLNEADCFDYITKIKFGFGDAYNYINITVYTADEQKSYLSFPVKVKSVVKGINIGWVFRNKESSLDALHSTSNLLFEYGYDTVNNCITSLTPVQQSSVWTTEWQLPNSYIFYYMCKTGFRFRLCNTDNFNAVIMTPSSLYYDRDDYSSDVSNIKGIFDFNLTKLSCFLPGASESSY